MKALVAVALALLAGGRALPGVSVTLTGTVVSSSSRELVLRDDNGTDHPFAIDNPSIPPAGVIAGTRVAVTFKELEDGTARLVAVDTWGAMDTTPGEDQPPVAKPATGQAADLVGAPSSVPEAGIVTAIPMSMLLATVVLGGAVALAALALRWTRRAF